MNPTLCFSDDDLSLFQELVFKKHGFSLDEEKKRFLILAITERAQKRGCVSIRQYYEFIKRDPQGPIELSDLLESIAPGETYFFRSQAQFSVLLDQILPEMVRQKMNSGNTSIRVWSAGCSRGDEAYSIAMAIREAFPAVDNWNISILGTDINLKSVLFAKEASYRRHDIRRLSPYYLDKYFQNKDSCYVLDDKVKKMVAFEYHNLAKDPFTLEAMQNLDIIFCRNVIIYFDLETTRKVISKFHGSLCPNGLLFLGHAETLWQINNTFEAIEFPQTYVYKKLLVPKEEEEEEEEESLLILPEIDFKSVAFCDPETLLEQASQTRGVCEKPSQTQEEELVYKDVERLVSVKDYVKALSLLDSIINNKGKSSIRAYFLKVDILVNEGKLVDAVTVLEKIITINNLLIEAYYFLGVLYYRMENLKAAQVQFRKVAYIDPNNALAYYNLANIYLSQKKFAQARHEFSNAIKALEKKGKGEKIPFHQDYTVEFLLMACKKFLEIISMKE